MRARILLLLAMSALAWAGGCGQNRESKIDPTKIPTPPVKPPERIAAAHILVAYDGAYGADSAVSRNRDEARAIADDVCIQARLVGADFGQLARMHSDDPTAKNGGYLDVFTRGVMLKPFEDAAFGM